MAEAYTALPLVMDHEGGFVDDPDDRGGATNFGISLRWLRAQPLAVGDIDGDGDIDASDIKALTREEAGALFVQEFWRFSALESQEVAGKLFDLAVNMGLPAAVKLAQRVVNSLGWALAVDGQWGAATQAAVGAAEPEMFLRELRALQALRYAEIAVANPSQKKFLHGWMRRVMS